MPLLDKLTLDYAGQCPHTSRQETAVSVETEVGELVPIEDRADEVLARRAALGDRRAYAEIFRRHSPALYRYALRMLSQDHQSAEDAVQEAMTKAWLRLGTFRAEATLRTWLFRLVANECANSARRRRPIPVDDGLLRRLTPSADDEGPNVATAAELRAALDLALRELPWLQRASWLLREVEELSYAEIATVLKVSTTVIRGQLYRARATLSIRMAQWR